MFDRWYAGPLQEKLGRPFVHLLFGARQTGKSTLLRALLPEDALVFDLADLRERSRLSARPELFLQACRALPADGLGQVVFVDETQTVPALFDAVQHLYDADKRQYAGASPCAAVPPASCGGLVRTCCRGAASCTVCTR